MKKVLTFAIVLLLLAASVPAFAQSYLITPTGVMQKDLVNLLYDTQKNLENFCAAPAGMCIGTGSAAKLKIANSVYVMVDGVFSADLGTTELTLTGDTQAVLTSKLYTACYNPTTATFEVVVGNSDDIDPSHLAVNYPKILVGYVKVATDATHTFVPGTTQLSAAGITDTYYDVMSRISRTRVRILNQ